MTAPEGHVLREPQLRDGAVTGGATYHGAVGLRMSDMDPRLPRGVAVAVPYEAVLRAIDALAARQRSGDDEDSDRET